MTEETRHSRMHRGHRIVAVKLGEAWGAIVHAPDGHIAIDWIEAASAQEAMIKGMRAVDQVVASAAGGR